MADTQGIRAGRAYVELGVSDQLTAGLRRAQQQLRAFGEGLRSIGTRLMALGTGAMAFMAGAVKAFAGPGDELLEMSKRTGVSVEALSELRYAAAQSGTDIESLEKSLRLMQRSIVDAARGSKSAGQALEVLGLTIRDLDGLAPEQQFQLIAERLSRIQDPTLRAATALELFGRSGTQLLPMIADGANGLEALRKQAQALGLTVSTEAAESADRLNDALKTLWTVTGKLYSTIGSALAPAVTALANAVTRTVVTVTAWIKEHKTLIISAAQTAVAIMAVGAALYGVGTVIVKALGIFAAFKAAVLGAGAFLSSLGSILAALLSPIGLVIVTVTALGGTLLYCSGLGAKALAWLGDRFRDLQETVGQVVEGIAGALAAGDIGLAARILWLSLKLVWQEGTAALQRVWAAGQKFFMQRFYDMWFGAQAIASEAWHALKVGWIRLTAFMADAWTRLSSRLAVEWNTVVNLASKAWNYIKGLFDENFDVEAANLAADQALVAAEQRINAEKDAALAAIADERQRDLAGEQARYEARQREIVEKDVEASRALDAETNAKLAKTRADLEQARQELDTALAQARKRRNEAAAPGSPQPAAGPQLNDLEDRIGGLGDLLAAKASVIGTFNVSSTLGLQAGGHQDRIADATERTARGIEQLRKDIRNNPMTFAP